MKLIYNQILNRFHRICMIAPIKIIHHNPGMVVMILIWLLPPYTLSGYRSRIRIQKRFCFVKNQTLFRIMHSIHTVRILKIINIQSKHNHRINTADSIMLRKRKNCIRLLVTPVIKKQLHTGCFQRTDRKIHALSQCRRSTDFIKSRPDIISIYIVQRNEMQCS